MSRTSPKVRIHNPPVQAVQIADQIRKIRRGAEELDLAAMNKAYLQAHKMLDDYFLSLQVQVIEKGAKA